MSLIEMVVVVALIGVVSSAVLVVLSSIYDGALRTNTRLEQIARSEDVLGGVNALLSRVRPDEGGAANGALGIQTDGLGTFNGRVPATPAGVLPPSLAGDQLVFQSGGQCFRLFYRADQQILWLGITDTCADQTNAGALRGPNQTGAILSGFYDPVLDALGAATERVDVPGLVAYPLARGVVPINDQTPIFTYRYPDLSAAATDREALLGSSNGFYAGASGLEQRTLISALEVQFAVLGNPDLPVAQQSISPKEYRQTIYLNQSCSVVQ
jgi:hypothetical protein